MTPKMWSSARRLGVLFTVTTKVRIKDVLGNSYECSLNRAVLKRVNIYEYWWVIRLLINQLLGSLPHKGECPYTVSPRTLLAHLNQHFWPKTAYVEEDKTRWICRKDHWKTVTDGFSLTQAVVLSVRNEIRKEAGFASCLPPLWKNPQYAVLNWEEKAREKRRGNSDSVK